MQLWEAGLRNSAVTSSSKSMPSELSSSESGTSPRSFQFFMTPKSHGIFWSAFLVVAGSKSFCRIWHAGML